MHRHHHGRRTHRGAHRRALRASLWSTAARVLRRRDHRSAMPVDLDDEDLAIVVGPAFASSKPRASAPTASTMRNIVRELGRPPFVQLGEQAACRAEAKPEQRPSSRSTGRSVRRPLPMGRPIARTNGTFPNRFPISVRRRVLERESCAFMEVHCRPRTRRLPREVQPESRAALAPAASSTARAPPQ